MRNNDKEPLDVRHIKPGFIFGGANNIWLVIGKHPDRTGKWVILGKGEVNWADTIWIKLAHDGAWDR